MWIVRLALRRPYTFVVAAMLIAVLGIVSIVTMPTDIFPKINIPVVSVIWTYGGLSPEEMQDRITTVVERAMTTTVSDIEHLESQSVRGTRVQYRQGLVDYLTVIDAERTLLGNQLSLAQTVNLQMAASIHVIKALGGGWTPQSAASQ